MTRILKRAALAATLATAAVATTLTSAGSAQAHYVGMGKGDLKGLAAVQLDWSDFVIWTVDQGVCGQIADEVTAGRKALGLTLGISKDDCINWMTLCLLRHGDNAYLMIPANNDYYCTPDHL
jgi:hypothetical protein